MRDFMDAWRVSEKEFPHDGTPAEKLAFCVRYAILAPSTYNIQPWYFRIGENSVSLFADRRHALPVIDPDDRELTIACACALFNLRLALRYFGYKDMTVLTPEADNPDLLARVSLGAKLEHGMDEDERKLFQAITRRHMNRGAFTEKDVGDELLRHLKSAASQEGAWLHVCTPPERKAIIQLIAEADHIQSGNKNFRRELASWADPRRQLTGDGMPGTGLRHADIMAAFTPTILRRFENGQRRPASDQELEAGSPVIAVLGSAGGGTAECLKSGAALMRVLLRAEALGLSVSLLNQPCEVPELRLRLHDELEHNGRAQMVLRIGYGGKPVFTPRRPLSAVVEFDGRGTAAAEKRLSGEAAAPRKSLLRNLLKSWKR